MMQVRSDRERFTQAFLHKWYPDHRVYWIDDIEDYKVVIAQNKYSETPQKLILVHVEEHTYIHNLQDLIKARVILKKSKFWGEECFIITNSKRDYETYKDILNIQWKPGVIDLFCYKKYDQSKIITSLDTIKYHTGFCHQNAHPGRRQVFNLLNLNKEKISINTLAGTATINNIKNNYVFFNGSRTAPNVLIEEDYLWTKESAFIIAHENYNLGCNNNRFAPTFSEKTFKAMHLYRPAIVFSAPGCRDYLQRFGFDTWDWFIDWSFENYSDPKDYLKYYLREIKRLLDTDINELRNLLEKNKDALEHNKNQVFKCLKEYNTI